MALDTSIYNLVRPVPSALAQIGEVENLRLTRQLGQQNDIILQQQREEQQRQQRMGQVYSQSVGPDGQLDPQLFQQNLLRDPLLAGAYPRIQESFAKGQEAYEKYQDERTKRYGSETTQLALFGGGLQASGWDPTLAMHGLTAMATVMPERARQLRAMLPQNPTPADIQRVFYPFVASNKDQQEIAEKGRKADIANITQQLYGAATTGGDVYRQAYAGLPPQYQSLYPHPDTFDATTTPDRVLRVGMSPNEIGTLQHSQDVQYDTRAHQDEDEVHAAYASEIGRIHEAYQDDSNAWKNRHPFGMDTPATGQAPDPQPEPPTYPSLDAFRKTYRQQRTNPTRAQIGDVRRLSDGRYVKIDRIDENGRAHGTIVERP